MDDFVVYPLSRLKRHYNYSTSSNFTRRFLSLAIIDGLVNTCSQPMSGNKQDLTVNYG